MIVLTSQLCKMLSIKQSLIILFLFVISFLCNPEEIKPLIINGDFEKEEKNILSFSEYTNLTKKLIDKIITNGYWHIVLHNTAYAKVDMSQKYAHVKIMRNNDLWYSIQFCYLPLLLEKGKNYTIEFSGKSEKPTEVILEICQVGSWVSYFKKTILLKSDWETYKLNFKMTSDTDTKARFEFNLGIINFDAFFDNIVIKETIEN